LDGGKLNKVIIKKTNYLIFVLISLVLWGYLVSIANNLRPIADEICALTEWDSQKNYLPFHLSSRFLATGFTWLSSLIWINSYLLGILANWLSVLFLTGLLFKNIYSLIDHEINKKESILYGFLFTPILILFVPTNVSAIYDTFLWFGGTWHAVGTLLLLNAGCAIINRKTSYGRLAAYTLVVSLWSETTAICLVAPLLLRFFFIEKKRVRTSLLFVMPLSATFVNLIVSAQSGRMEAIKKDSYFDFNNFLGVTYMSGPLFLRGLIISALIFSAIDFVSPRLIPINHQTVKVIILYLAGTCLLLLVTQYMTYGTWRASILYALSGILIGFILVEIRILNRAVSGLLSLLFFLLISAQVLPGLVSLNNYVENRNNWWTTNLIREGASKNLIETEEEYREHLPADFGGGAWINDCFQDLVKIAK
jgi:hypothetical protein